MQNKTLKPNADAKFFNRLERERKVKSKGERTRNKNHLIVNSIEKKSWIDNDRKKVGEQRVKKIDLIKNHRYGGTESMNRRNLFKYLNGEECFKKRSKIYSFAWKVKKLKTYYIFQ